MQQKPQPTRITTRFGVVIPPWRNTNAEGCITVEFILTGLTPSKKNRMRATFNFSWVFGQIRKFMKEQNGKVPSLGDMGKFMFNLVRNIHPYLYKPQEIIDWEDRVRPVLALQASEWKKTYERHGLKFPITRCSIKTLYYWADERTRDNVNKDEAIYDILVSAGIIVDDNYKCLFKVYSDSQCFKDEIVDHITRIYLTAYDW